MGVASKICVRFAYITYTWNSPYCFMLNLDVVAEQYSNAKCHNQLHCSQTVSNVTLLYGMSDWLRMQFSLSCGVALLVFDVVRH